MLFLPILSLLLTVAASDGASASDSPPSDLGTLIQDNFVSPDILSPTWINDPCCPNNLNAVQFAAKLNSKALPAILAAGGSPTQMHEETQTSPLHFACREGSWQSAKELLLSLPAAARAKEIARLDEHGNNALHLAALTGQVAVATLLIKHSDTDLAFLTAVNGNGNTPLQIGAYFGFEKFLLKLLNQPSVVATMNDLAPNGRNALTLAVSNNQAKAVQALLLAGADASSPVSAADLAVEKGHDAILNVLVNPHQEL